MKTSPLALAALVVAGLATPVFADSINGSDSGFDASYILTQLQQKGIAATAVYENGADKVRAVVPLADGSEVFQYFYEDGLRPVAGSSSGNTRVLSDLDTGARATAPVVTDSLLIDNFFD